MTENTDALYYYVRVYITKFSQKYHFQIIYLFLNFLKKITNYIELKVILSTPYTY
jgi:hypothetical protein